MTYPRLNSRDLTIDWDSKIQSSGKISKYSIVEYCRYCGVNTKELKNFMLKSYTKPEYKDSQVCNNCLNFLRECLYLILFRLNYKKYTNSNFSNEPYLSKEPQTIESISKEDFEKIDKFSSYHRPLNITINGFLLHIRTLDIKADNVYRIIINNYFQIILKINKHHSQRSFFHNYSIINRCFNENLEYFIPFNLLYSNHIKNRYHVCTIYEYIQPHCFSTFSNEHFVDLYRQLQFLLNYGILYVDFKFENTVFGYDMKGILKYYLIDFDDIVYRVNSHKNKRQLSNITYTYTFQLPFNSNVDSGIVNHFYNNTHIDEYIRFIEYILKSIYISIFSSNNSDHEELTTNKIQRKIYDTFLYIKGFVKYIKTNSDIYSSYEDLLKSAPEELNDFKLELPSNTSSIKAESNEVNSHGPEYYKPMLY